MHVQRYYDVSLSISLHWNDVLIDFLRQIYVVYLGGVINACSTIL